MNNKILYPVILLSIILLSYLYFSKSPEIKNYPSLGTDIVAFGDSLVEGVGAGDGQSFVSLLSKKIGKPIINLGVSGNTTEDGLNRLSELDKYNPKVVLLLLGGNDYLKKVPIENTFNNLSKIIEYIQAKGSTVILLGIRGSLIFDKFDSEFERLRDKYKTAYVSDVLDGIFGDMKYMSDAVHPNDLGYKKIADRVYPVLEKLLK